MRLAMVGFGARMALRLMRHPRLVLTALAEAKALAPNRWWSRRPFLPIPPDGYMAFRLATATGDASGVPDLDETIEWLEWCRSMRRITGTGQGPG